MNMKTAYSISSKEIFDFMIDVLRLKKVDDTVSKYVAEGLVQASLRGVDSHGVRLFPHYLKALDAGRINSNPDYNVEDTSASTAILDADHTFGHAAGMEAAKKAVELAEKAGTGHVTVKNSTHFGAAAYYALEIAKHDMIGMSFTHADSLMVTHGSGEPFLGTNPLCFAAPCWESEPFCLDMATSMLNFNKVLQFRASKKPVPAGTCTDNKGVETTNSEEAAYLLPIGQYKGFGLALMIEVLCGVLTGMAYGRNITSMYKDPIEKKRYLGHFFMAMRIDCFEEKDRFKKRMKEMLDEIRDQDPLNDDTEVMVANDPEIKHYNERIKEGVPVEAAAWDEFMAISEKYNVNLRGK